MCKLSRTIALCVGLVGLGGAAAQAATGLVIANTSGYNVVLNYNTPIRNGSAAWSDLDATILGPGSARIEVIDTQKSCGNSAWTIAFNFYDGNKLYERGSHRMQLRFGQIGCTALHLSPQGARWAEVATSHCTHA